ncbi:hypothetical protein ACFWXH_26355 [Mesorhizobium sp. NPDC059054]|uniref:hypothetical protein n=1 Tax=Mesorhizobium sp. NPDC059054 TaxID=3346711 RepID=UPI00369E2641
MRVFILIAMLTVVAACDGGGPTIQKGEGPVTQKVETGEAPGLPVGTEANQQKIQPVQPASSPQ